MTPSCDACWFVAQTRVHAEGKAARHLTRQGFEVYLPRYLKRRRHARKIETVAAPLFPGYLFVAIDMATQRWRSIRSTLGVSRLVANGEEPAMVASGIVGALRQREDEKGFITLAQRPAFAPGDKVRVLAGALMDTFGLFDGMGDHERVAILLDLLGRKVRVLIDADMIAAA
jgi:transcriptional antiterminator RfaH